MKYTQQDALEALENMEYITNRVSDNYAKMGMSINPIGAYNVLKKYIEESVYVVAGYQMKQNPNVVYPASHKPTDIDNFITLYKKSDERVD